MEQKTQKSMFGLIKSPKRRKISEEVFPLPKQAELFAAFAPNMLIFVTFPKATDEEFLASLDLSKPGLIIDFRRFPRFDIGSLTRQKVFNEFKAREISYVDFAWPAPGSDGQGDTCPNLGPELQRIKGRVMILLEERPHTAAIVEAITKQILKHAGGQWQIVRIPSYSQNPAPSEVGWHRA
jgi:hypothetical protein